MMNCGNGQLISKSKREDRVGLECVVRTGKGLSINDLKRTMEEEVEKIELDWSVLGRGCPLIAGKGSSKIWNNIETGE